jgi:murein DD-endopeptidase MepM/ murein hydrolase activator NlpD
VQQVLAQSDQLAGNCTAQPADWNVALPASAALGDSTVANPVPGWQRGRIDMGVDFSASPGTPILAPLDSVVIRTGAPGWPGGGGGVLLQLPNGRYMFIYESVEALVHAGQRVDAGQVIAVAGPTSLSTGIEIGFADVNGVPLAHDVYTEGDVTAWGQLMDQFLSELGAPPRA